MIGPAWSTGDRQHHITDLTAQGSPAKDGISTQDTFQRYLIPWFSILKTDARCEDENEEPPLSIDPYVVRTKLSGHCDHALFFRAEALH